MQPETQKLSQLLSQEIHLATQLLDLMLEEKNILENHSPEKLVTLTDTKTRCLDQIEMVSRSRSRLLQGLSSAPTTVERMNQFIEQQPQTVRELLTTAVDKLEDILEKCRKQNATNGMIISVSQRNIQRNLNIIRGADNESMTYTPKGQTTSVGTKLGSVKV